MFLRQFPIAPRAAFGFAIITLLLVLTGLFSLNRINVAVSRAKALALVFGSDRLREANCSSIEQMRLVNTLCALPPFSAPLSTGS